MPFPQNSSRGWTPLSKFAAATAFSLAASVGMAQDAPALAIFGGSALKDTSVLKYGEFFEKIRKHEITHVTILSDRQTMIGTGPGIKPLTSDLDNHNIFDEVVREGIETVKIDATPPAAPGFLERNSGILTSLAFLGILIGFSIWMMKRAQKGSGSGFSFGKSKARMVNEADNKITFADVAGCDEAKEEVKELVDFLRDPKKFSKLGGRMPRGVLLVGPPGTGKTLLAKAVAGEAKVPFFSISGSDFVEMFVGVGAARVRDMFENAKKNAPCIIFIDEIDAVGKHRGNGMTGGNDEREQTLNQMLVEMDGFETNLGVIVMAATNRPDVLDPGLLRPGRFDRQVYVTLPDINGREQILNVHARKVPLDPNVKLDVVARGTPGFSGADLANLINEAALFAARSNHRTVQASDFDKAKDKIMMGPERKGMIMAEDERRNTARHETGHLWAMKKLPKGLVEPFYKATIIPRGKALGVAMGLPEADRYSQNKAQMKAMMVMLYGGWVAEIKKNGLEGVTSGASNDIERATEIARAMVMKFGMSEKLGPRRFVSGEGMSFMGPQSTQMQPAANETMALIDAEIDDLIKEAHERMASIIEEDPEAFEKVADALFTYETLTNEDVDAILNGGDIVERKRLEHQQQVLTRLAEEKTRITDNLAANSTTSQETDKPFSLR